MTRFNGSIIVFLGDIVVLVLIMLVIMMVKFYVMEYHFPYNTILGQAWIHGMKAIPSTYYKK